MAKSFDSTTQALLEAGHVQFRYLAQFALTSGTWRLGNHTPGEYINWDSQSWLGVGQLASISDLRTATGLAADQATITVDASLFTENLDDYSEETSALRDALREDMVNRRVDIWELYEHPDTGVATRAVKLFAGPVESKAIDLKGGKVTIKVRSNRQALGWATGRTRSDADQQRINASDRSLRHAAKVAARNGKLPVGYNPSQSGARTSGRGGNPVRDAVRGLQLY
jgi:hypothetical protein